MLRNISFTHCFTNSFPVTLFFTQFLPLNSASIFFCIFLLVPVTWAEFPFSQSQGIDGNVYLMAGNKMPSPDRKPASPQGIRATVLIYELTNGRQAVREGQTPYYSAIRTKRISQVETDDQGYFVARLPPGHYSVFIKKNTLFYANRWDSNNNIAPAEVIAGKMTRVECGVEGDRPATY
jgi:hypothetical protein